MGFDCWLRKKKIVRRYFGVNCRYLNIKEVILCNYWLFIKYGYCVVVIKKCFYWIMYKFYVSS